MLARRTTGVEVVFEVLYSQRSVEGDGIWHLWFVGL